MAHKIRACTRATHRKVTAATCHRDRLMSKVGADILLNMACLAHTSILVPSRDLRQVVAARGLVAR